MINLKASVLLGALLSKGANAQSATISVNGQLCSGASAIVVPAFTPDCCDEGPVYFGISVDYANGAEPLPVSTSPVSGSTFNIATTTTVDVEAPFFVGDVTNSDVETCSFTVQLTKDPTKCGPPCECDKCLKEFEICDIWSKVPCCDDLVCTQIDKNGQGRCIPPRDPESCAPTAKPTPHPTKIPTSHPTKIPTPPPTWSDDGHHPTPPPTWSHDGHETPHPTKYPTHHPTKIPTPPPTWSHDGHETPHPTKYPTHHPTKIPTPPPTWSHDGHETPHPTKYPTHHPTKIPTPPPTWSHDGHPTPPPVWSNDGHETPHPTKYPTHHPTKIPTPPPAWSDDGHPTPPPVWSHDGHHEPAMGCPSGRYWADERGMCRCDCPVGSGFMCGPAAPPLTTYPSIATCCALGLSWVDFNYCDTRSKGTYSDMWYVDWTDETCVKDCDHTEEGGRCAFPTARRPISTLYTSVEACCARLTWVNQASCIAG